MEETLENFYYIKVINTRNGERGYICEKDGKMLVSNGLVYEILKRFPTYQEAQKYYRENKIERGGVTAHIRDMEDLKKEGLIKVADKDLFTVSTLDEVEKIFYDTLKQEYYMSNQKTGFCIWYTEKDVIDFIAACKFPIEVKCLKISK